MGHRSQLGFSKYEDEELLYTYSLIVIAAWVLDVSRRSLGESAEKRLIVAP